MTDTNKSYRIRTKVGDENTKEFISVNADLVQDYDTFEVLSVNINSKDMYRLHNSNYGVIVGRVIANNGFGIPNAKVSIFIEADSPKGSELNQIYPFTSAMDKNGEGIRYNLLPNERVNGCHQVVGTFPSKRYALDNDVILEIFDKYYTYTTRTNNAGDYMICGVPTGAHTIHMDLDLSDCGVLSQRPRDFVYKGYTIEQFESPTKFKGGTDYNNLSQIISQDQVVNVNPFWGNDDLGETIGITRADINVNFKFEPTCVFMGSIFSDNSSNGFSQKCIPTEHMGNMEELVTGEGRIEMIRKTPGGSVEQFQIKGDKLINADGVWCYQIPMNLDYMVTDEYGNMVPTDNPEKGIPTRTSVRFRISMEDAEENTDNFFRAKVLVPHNPQSNGNEHEDYDYDFGSYTQDTSFRDLFWNNVYSVKSYIPRIQKSKNWRRKPMFSGIKRCQVFGPNNPMPYNNIRIKLPLMFTIMCIILKIFILLVKIINTLMTVVGYIFARVGTIKFFKLQTPKGDCSNCSGWRIGFYILGEWIGFTILESVRNSKWWIENWKLRYGCIFPSMLTNARNLHLIVLKDGLCPDLDNWYFSPLYYNLVKNYLKYDKNCTGAYTILSGRGCCNDQFDPDDPNESKKYNIMKQTILYVLGEDDGGNPTEGVDTESSHSIDAQNADDEEDTHCLTVYTDYLIPCIEINLAQEYKVINFDFYNDWVNGTIYNPRWSRYKRSKVRFLGITWAKEKLKGCMDDTRIYSRARKYVQQCSITYRKETSTEYKLYTNVKNPLDDLTVRQANQYHKRRGFEYSTVFGKNGGICHETSTLKGQKVYYLKPCEFKEDGRRVIFYATDIILLGTFNDCDLNGIPKTFRHLSSSTYIMPTNLALTNMDTNGPLYAKNDGTICMGPNNGTTTGYHESNEANFLLSGNGITQVNTVSGNPLLNEYEYYSTFEGTTIHEKTENGKNENGFVYGDTIALTEAAGIAWNYTGPGQIGIREEQLYYPGGHFLGLTCINSQTNLKSCLNLERICEIGTNMSQRQEHVRGINGNKLSYLYSVPTGFISGDDISDTDFRSMFATLNRKRLIATKRSKTTGYLIYDFNFLMPANFDGAFKKVVYSSSDSYYNHRVVVTEEDLTNYNVYKGEKNDDYDSEEPLYTQTRTRESDSTDYYAFRFGLSAAELNKDDVKRKKFLVSYDEGTGNARFLLPQYENSYYFYFGLKNGATALDEFNKQFYAECDNLKIKKEPNVILTCDEDFCRGKAKIHVSIEGLSVPLESIKVESNLPDFDSYIINGSIYNTSVENDVLRQETFFLPMGTDAEPEFDFGIYYITVIDDDGVEIRRVIKPGSRFFRYNVNSVDYTYPVTGNSRNYEIFEGGFGIVTDFKLINAGYEIEDLDYLSFDLFTFENVKVGQSETIEFKDDTKWYLAYCDEVNTWYKLQMTYKCPNGPMVSVFMKHMYISDNSDLTLEIGSNSYNRHPLTESSIMNKNSAWWWEGDKYDIGAENSADDYKKWFYRKMFFKDSNLTPFDSRVFVKERNKGTKVFWGAPQGGSNFYSLNGYSHIYCSEFPFSLPKGTYLDDTRSRISTYGITWCHGVDTGSVITATTNNNQPSDRGGNDGNDGNCTFNYCAQVYDGSKVGGKYRLRFERPGIRKDESTAYFNNVLNGQGGGNNYFHEGYGCIFKPLPFGDIEFLTFNRNGGDEDLQVILSSMNYNFGIIYPTFIYPVMQRPFYFNFVNMLWSNLRGEFNTNALVLTTKDYDYGNKYYLKIHNGVTFNNEFDVISVLGNSLPTTVSECDTYGISENSSNDRFGIYDGYTNKKLNNKNILIEVKEKIPTDISEDNIPKFTALATERKIEDDFYFANKMYYIIYDDRNLVQHVNFDDVFYGDDDEYVYFVGYYNKTTNYVKFLEEFNDNDEHKYVFSKTVNVYYVLCTFNDDDRIRLTKKFTNLNVMIKDLGNNLWQVNFSYYPKNSNSKVKFNEYIIYACENTTYPEKINEILTKIYNGYEFNIKNSGKYKFPFRPVLNYYVAENIKIGNTTYSNPYDFLLEMIKNSQIKKVKSDGDVNNLGPINETTDIVFGLGMKTIKSPENNSSASYIFKAYGNIMRTNGAVIGDCRLDLTRLGPLIGGTAYGSTMNNNVQENTFNIISYETGRTVTYEIDCECACDLRLSLTNDEFCHLTINGVERTPELGIIDVFYDGITMVMEINIDPMSGNEDRTSKLTIQSFVDHALDTKEISIVQKARPVLYVTADEYSTRVYSSSPHGEHGQWIDEYSLTITTSSSVLTNETVVIELHGRLPEDEIEIGANDVWEYAPEGGDPEAGLDYVRVSVPSYGDNINIIGTHNFNGHYKSSLIG